jgi:hypothetical protein
MRLITDPGACRTLNKCGRSHVAAQGTTSHTVVAAAPWDAFPPVDLPNGVDRRGRGITTTDDLTGPPRELSWKQRSWLSRKNPQAPTQPPRACDAGGGPRPIDHLVYRARSLRTAMKIAFEPIVLPFDYWRMNHVVRAKIKAQGGLYAPDRFDVFTDGGGA